MRAFVLLRASNMEKHGLYNALILGKAKVIREDFLEEAVEVYISSFPAAFTKLDEEANLNPLQKIQARKSMKAGQRQQQLQQVGRSKSNTLASESDSGRNGYGGLLFIDAAEDGVESGCGMSVTNGNNSFLRRLPPWGKPTRYRNLITGHWLDPVTMFAGGITEEVEFMIFKAGMMISGRGAVTTMLMSTCVSVGMQVLHKPPPPSQQKQQRQQQRQQQQQQQVKQNLENQVSLKDTDDEDAEETTINSESAKSDGDLIPDNVEGIGFSGSNAVANLAGPSRQPTKLSEDYKYVEPKHALFNSITNNNIDDDDASVGSNSLGTSDSSQLGTSRIHRRHQHPNMNMLAVHCSRVKQLIHDSKKRMMPELAEEITLKVDALMNIYVAAPHRVIASRIIYFPTTNILRFRRRTGGTSGLGNSSVRTEVALGRKSRSSKRGDKNKRATTDTLGAVPLCAVVQIIEAGESMIIRGIIKQVTEINDHPQNRISERFLVPAPGPTPSLSCTPLDTYPDAAVSAVAEAETGQTSDWASVYPVNAIPRAPPSVAVCDFTQLCIRPLVLLPREVHMALDLIKRKRELEEKEKQQRRQKLLQQQRKEEEIQPSYNAPSSDVLMKYLVEFLFSSVRLVSCTTRRRSPILPQSQFGLAATLAGPTKEQRRLQQQQKKASRLREKGTGNNDVNGPDEAESDDDDSSDFDEDEEDDEEMADIMDNVSKMVRYQVHVEHHEGEFGVNDDDDVEGSGAEVAGDEAVRWSAAHTTALRLCLPGAEYLRRERNSSRMEELAVRLIQKIYRGFHGRSRYRRLIARHKEQRRQKELLDARLDQLKAIRWRRHVLACRVQARVRGMLQRLALEEMRRAALLIQSRVRVLLARKHLEEERQRQEGGPAVKEQLRSAIDINGSPVMVVVYRCGNNYRICGQDVVSNAVYDCFVYQSELMDLCDAHNRKYPGVTVADKARQLKVWQYDRVCEYLLRKLRLVKRITPLTRELGTSKRDSDLELVIYDKGKPSIRSLGDRSNLHRGLMDQRETTKRFAMFFEYEAKMKEKQKQAKMQQEREREHDRKRLQELDSPRKKSIKMFEKAK
jgi:flagellar biogenesis protein FliO